MTAANPPPMPEADIHAYVDGRLPADGCASVEAAMLRDPELAARVAEHARAECGRCAMRSIRCWPSRFPRICSPRRCRRPRERRAFAAGSRPRSGSPRRSSSASASVGSLRDALIERAGTPTSFARQAAFAHALYAADVNRPVEIWAAEEKRLVNWLTKRLGFQVHAPDLNGVGYALVGGRLVAGNEKPTALFMYENADKQRLSLQVRKQAAGPGETAFRYAAENGVGVFYWIDDACGYALSGNVDRAQLLKIAHVVYGQLAAAEAAAPE